jgi:hypothetical protein
MGAPTGIDVEALRMECEQLKKDKAILEATIKDLNARVHFQDYCRDAIPLIFYNFRQRSISIFVHFELNLISLYITKVMSIETNKLW